MNVRHAAVDGKLAHRIAIKIERSQFIGSAICLACVSVLVFQFSSRETRAAIADGLVFAHDFEQVTGSEVTALVGPAATMYDASPTQPTSVNSNNPLSFSPQHVQAPDRLPTSPNTTTTFARIDTNTKLTAATTALSFSIFINQQGNTDTNAAILLSTIPGFNPDFTNGQFHFDTLQQTPDATTRRLRLITKGPAPAIIASVAMVPTHDSDWHQVGFVYDSGSVQFYLDGAPLGASGTWTGVSQIDAQDLDWHLLENAEPPYGTNNAFDSEYFHNGYYDEAALWTRALSAQEMTDLYTQGLSALLTAVPPVPGDFDSDGDVDGADFVAWQTHFPTASGATLADGDADGDGDVDGADFVVWQTHFPTPPGSGVSTIPEPDSIVLFSLAFSLGFVVLRRERASQRFAS